MSWYVVVFSLCGGALAAYFVARLTKHHQPQNVEPPAPPHKIKVDVFLHPATFFSPASPLANCDCDECLAAEMEFAALKEEFQQRMAHFDASRSASPDIRRLEFLRWLVQNGRLSEDL